MNPDDAHRLLSAWAGVPVLPGARCRHKHHLFDPPGEDEPADVTAQRHAQAVKLCGRCSAAEPCSQWFESLPPRLRPEGVIAGRIHTKRRPNKGRPTEAGRVPVEQNTK